jgi:hypothetical protein
MGVSFVQLFLVLFACFVVHASQDAFFKYLRTLEQKNKKKHQKQTAMGWRSSLNTVFRQTNPDGSVFPLNRCVTSYVCDVTESTAITTTSTDESKETRLYVLKYYVSRMTHIFYRGDGRRLALSVYNYWSSDSEVFPTGVPFPQRGDVLVSNLKDCSRPMVAYSHYKKYKKGDGEGVVCLDKQSNRETLGWEDSVKMEALELDTYNGRPPRTIYETLNEYESGHKIYFRRDMKAKVF